ncbi:MAG: hypothetical protein NC453_16565 [Muribaculum sp.]|nr:hypothetical protein [Muribaculum sp.]
MSEKQRLSNFATKKTKAMKLKSLVCSFMLSILLPLFCYGARTDSFIVYLSVGSDPTEMDPPPTKRRAGSQTIPCEISIEKVDLSGIDISGISLYEVHDINGVTLASFESEQEFITYIFTMEETVGIRLHLDGFVLSGFLYL